ncbi:MAG: ABC transporter permease [Treponema sp.]|nr:ABC transporter permease [Treponema sp.]
MALFFRFLRIQFLKVRSVFPKIFLASVLTFSLLSVIAFLFVRNMNFSGNKQKISIGIVGDLSSKYFEFGVNALKMVDSSRFFLDLQLLSEEDAKKALRKRKIAAFVVVPDGFFEAVECGENNLQVSYYTSGGNSGVEGILKDEVAEIVTTLLLHAQAGIFGMERIALKTNQLKNLREDNYDLNLKYVKWTLDRTKFVRVEETGLSEGLSVTSYYLISLLLVFFAFFGLGSLSFFISRTQSQRTFFALNGISSVNQIFCEFLVYFFLQTVVLLFACALLYVFAVSDLVKIDLWKYSGAFSGVLSLFTAFLPVIVLLSSIQFFLFEFNVNQIALVSLQFLSMTALAFSGGCFYPLDFFPEALKNFGKLSPLGEAFSFVNSIFSNKFSFTCLMIMVLYSVIFFFLTCALRKVRVKEGL